MVEWPKATGTQNTSAHKELFDTMGAEIAKAVLGQTLTSDQGQRGSQALGNVHNEVRKDILEADAIGVAQAFREYVLRPYVEANWGANAPVPLFRFLTEDSADTTALSTSIKNLTDAGVKTIPEAWVREQFGIPEPEGDEPLVGQPTPQDPNAPTPPPAEPGGPQPGDPAQPPADPNAEPAQAA
jgi:phage gp29-like protein